MKQMGGEVLAWDFLQQGFRLAGKPIDSVGKVNARIEVEFLDVRLKLPPFCEGRAPRNHLDGLEIPSVCLLAHGENLEVKFLDEAPLLTRR